MGYKKQSRSGSYYWSAHYDYNGHFLSVNGTKWCSFVFNQFPREQSLSNSE